MRQIHISRIVTLAAGMLTVTAVPVVGANTHAITALGSLGYGVRDGLAINATGQVTSYSYTGATVPTGGCCGTAAAASPSPAWPISTMRSRTAMAP